MTQDRSLSRIERPKSLEEQAYFDIKQAILRGQFLPGEFLAEMQVAQELGISKTPIRKAMARLQQEGFLVNIPYKGYNVAEISAADTKEIYELRRILECHLVRETALQFTEAELDEMEASFQAAEDAMERRDYILYLACNREFHHAFPRKYGNQRILKVLTNLDEHVQRILLHKMQQEGSYDLSSRDHRLILAAIRTGDIEAAESLMRDHLAGFPEASDA
jgi:DNA-binding GntR family transcriptional regulator